MIDVHAINEAIKLINSKKAEAAPYSDFGFSKLYNAVKYLDKQVAGYFGDDATGPDGLFPAKF